MPAGDQHPVAHPIRMGGNASARSCKGFGKKAGCLGGHRAEVRGGHQQTSATKSVKSRLGLSLPVRRKRRASDGASALLYEHNLPNP
jgi:hypothetical protein